MKLFGVEIINPIPSPSPSPSLPSIPIPDDESQQQHSSSSNSIPSQTSTPVPVSYITTSSSSSSRNPRSKSHRHHPYRRSRPHSSRRHTTNLQKKQSVGAEIFEVSVELRLWDDPWLIKKRITESDLNGLSRLLLPRKEVEKYVLPQMSEEMMRQVKNSKGGLSVKVVDYDTAGMEEKHDMGFKYWASSNSYILNRTWSRYAKHKRLKVDDEIGLFWNKYEEQFNIRVFSTQNNQ